MADTKELLTCPACGKNMTKIYMAEQKINVDICLDGCGGILFDNRELEKFDEVHENAKEILEAIKSKDFYQTNETKQRICTICGNTMLKMETDTDNVQLDCCPLCGAKFLDNGELQRIRHGIKDTIPQEVLDAIELGFEKHIDAITWGLKPKKSSPRRQFVEDLVRAFLFR